PFLSDICRAIRFPVHGHSFSARSPHPTEPTTAPPVPSRPHSFSEKRLFLLRASNGGRLYRFLFPAQILRDISTQRHGYPQAFFRSRILRDIPPSLSRSSPASRPEGSQRNAYARYCLRRSPFRPPVYSPDKGLSLPNGLRPPVFSEFLPYSKHL